MHVRACLGRYIQQNDAAFYRITFMSCLGRGRCPRNDAVRPVSSWCLSAAKSHLFVRTRGIARRGVFNGRTRPLSTLDDHRRGRRRRDRRGRKNRASAVSVAPRRRDGHAARRRGPHSCSGRSCARQHSEILLSTCHRASPLRENVGHLPPPTTSAPDTCPHNGTSAS